MPKVDDEQMEAMLQEARHDDLISALREIAATRPADYSKVEMALGRIEKTLEGLGKNSLANELRPMLGELARSIRELKRPISKKPTVFNVVRNKLGFIEQVVAEEESSDG